MQDYFEIVYDIKIYNSMPLFFLSIIQIYSSFSNVFKFSLQIVKFAILEEKIVNQNPFL